MPALHPARAGRDRHAVYAGGRHGSCHHVGRCGTIDCRGALRDCAVPMGAPRRGLRNRHLHFERGYEIGRARIWNARVYARDPDDGTDGALLWIAAALVGVLCCECPGRSGHVGDDCLALGGGAVGNEHRLSFRGLA